MFTQYKDKNIQTGGESDKKNIKVTTLNGGYDTRTRNCFVSVIDVGFINTFFSCG